MLLILATLASDLIVSLRFLEYDCVSLLMEGSGASIMFVFGQLDTYLFRGSICDVFNTNTTKGRGLARALSK